MLLDGEWRVFDPTYGMTWRRPQDGELATAADLALDSALLASVRVRRPDYPVDVYTYRNVYHLRWEKLPGLPWLRERLRPRLGDARVRAIGTPYLYDRPTFLVGGIFLMLGGMPFAWFGWRRAGRRRRGTGSRGVGLAPVRNG